MKVSTRDLGLVLTLLMLGIVASGAGFYSVQRRHLQGEVESQLRIIAHLKAQQIAQWRTARMAEATVQVESPFMTAAVEQWMASPSAELAEALRARLFSFQRHYHYRVAMLADAGGRVRLSTEATIGPLHTEVASALAAAFEDRRTAITELYAAPPDPAPHVGVVAPFFARRNGGEVPAGALVLLTEARDFLDPLARSWPAPSASAETVLVRRDGDSVLYLSDLRHRSNAALRLRIPLSQTGTPEVQAALGGTGIVYGTDYRGVAVMSALQPIPGSAWHLVAKMDTAEAFQAWRSRSGSIVGLVLLLGLLAVASIWAIWKRNERDHYRDLFESEAARRVDDARHQAAELASRQALAESEARFRRTLDDMMEGCQIIGRDWRYLYVNREVARQGNRTREELLGRTMMEVYPGIDQTEMFAALRRCMESRVPEQMENRFVHPDGRVGWFQLSIQPSPEGLFVLSVDITGRKEAEQEQARLHDQLQQAKKMETIGRLAGGVAHDFNNMLQTILGNVELALEAAGPTGPVAENLREIQRAGRHSADLTRQLLGFARKQTIRPQVLDLNGIVGDLMPMLRRLIREGIELDWKPYAGALPVRVDPSQVQQIVVNLATNARDAIGEVGRIVVETAPATLDEAGVRDHPDAVAGTYALLSVRDTGRGLSPEARDHLFEPFFTSKPDGQGTGLGLAMIYGIVRQNRGVIDVVSEPGSGTVFRIYLPRCEGDTPHPSAPPAPATHRGTETVLMVEDEPAILRLGKKKLEDMGYTVLAAGRPEQALQIAAAHAGTLRLLVTDVVMPGMTGHDLARRLSASHPGLKCLYVSGYTDDAFGRRGVLEPDFPFLQKPFSMDALAAAVRSALDR